METPPSRAENRFLALLKSPRPNPVVVGHRGDSCRAPENTLEAARLAWQSGADAWELDVQLSSDGVPIVIHDETLTRTTDVQRRFAADQRSRDGFRVCDFTLEEIRSLDAGSWFVDENGGPRSAGHFGTLLRLEQSAIAHYRSGQVKIPTLAEALELTKELDWLVNIEIKSFPDRPSGLVQRVLEVVVQTGSAREVLISSFDHPDIASANSAGREYALGILTATPIARICEYVTEVVGAETVHVSSRVLGAESVSYRRKPSARSLRTDLVEALKARGIPLLVYTVNEYGPVSLARHVGEVLIDGIFTDDPAGVIADFDGP